MTSAVRRGHDSKRSPLRESPRFNEAHCSFGQLLDVLLAYFGCGRFRVAVTPDAVARKLPHVAGRESIRPNEADDGVRAARYLRVR